MPPNVLLVVADSVRARNTTVYGHRRDTTPFLQRLSEQSTVYEHAYAPAPKSLTSHISMFTGFAVEEHDITNRDRALAPGHTVWETLAADHDYETGVFSPNTFLTKLDVGLKDAFHHVESGNPLPREEGLDLREYLSIDGSPEYVEFMSDAVQTGSVVKSFLNGLAALRQSGRESRYGERFVDAFLEWESERGGPWAACINLMDAHTPYLPPTDSDQWADEDVRALAESIDGHVWQYQCGHRPWSELSDLERLYDEAIRYVDTHLERLYQELRSQGEADETLLIVTADHGEGFGEYSPIRPDTRLAGHGESKVHEVLLHVPLVVKRPGQTDDATVSEPVSLTSFPDVVTAAVECAKESPLFVSDDPVVATAVGLEDDDSDGAGRYCEDISSFTGRGRVLYERTSGGVSKYVTWKSHETALEIESDGTVRKLENVSPSERVNAVFDEFGSAGVSRANRGEVDEATLQELKDLGYA